MGGKKSSEGTNSKAEAGRARKAEHEAKVKAEQDRQREAAEAASWQAGANNRRASREEEAANKADEAARKKREKAALLAAEEEALGKGGKAKAGNNATLKKKAKPKNDLALLEDALQKDADKKVKKKRAEMLEKERQKERELQEKKEREAAEAAKKDPLLANTEQMIGVTGSDQDNDDLGRQANVARMEAMAEGTSGLDGALGSLDLTGGGGQAKSAKALYNQFEARMLPVVKEDNPGLRLTQYKERIWAMWKKSPENPANQVP